MDNNQSNLENRRTESSNIRDESAEPSRGVLNRGILNRRNFNRLAAGMGLAAAAPLGLAPLNAWGRDRKDSPNEKSQSTRDSLTFFEIKSKRDASEVRLATTAWRLVSQPVRWVDWR